MRGRERVGKMLDLDKVDKVYTVVTVVILQLFGKF